MDALTDIVVKARCRSKHSFNTPAPFVEASAWDVYGERTQRNRQKKQWFILLDDGQIHQHKTDNPHDDHRSGNHGKSRTGREHLCD